MNDPDRRSLEHAESTRRGFLRGLAAAPFAFAPFAYASRAVPVDGNSRSASSEGRTLLIVELVGANDGLNTIVPLRDDAYLAARPSLRIPSTDALRIDDSYGFHPALRPFADLLEAGELAIVPSVGHAELSRSHFEARARWHSGGIEPTKVDGTGWLGRALDTRNDASRRTALFLGPGTPPPALRGRRTLATPLESTADLTIPVALGSSTAATRLDELELVAAARKAVAEAKRIGDAIGPTEATTIMAPLTNVPVRPAGVESDLPRSMRFAASLVRDGVAPAVMYTTQDDYDTHRGQAPRHAALLAELGESIRSLRDALHRDRLLDRVLVVVFSEFGRTLEENHSRGTDHGSAGPVFLIGAGVEPGFRGAQSDLQALVDREPEACTDFRGVEATLLDSWLGIDSLGVLGARFDSLPLLRRRS